MTNKYDIAIIGAGSGGLTIAGGAAQLGLKTILFEEGEMGGDCLNSGCVPSKSIIAAAHAAHVARHSQIFGVTAEPNLDFARTMAHVQEVIAGIA
ncbi:MAG: FAD-dependent oxidoreductase, partial [Pacificimonas sp.]